LDQKSLAKNDGAGFMTNPASAIVNSVGSQDFRSEAGYCTALSHDRVRSSEQDRRCRASSNALKITGAASCSEQPSTAIPRGGSSIDRVDWKNENNEMDC
jgi:hypothetical protein